MNVIKYGYTFAPAAPKTLSQLVVTQPGGTCTAPRKLCQTDKFDSLGRLLSVDDSSAANAGAGTLTTYCYDPLDRITKVFYTARRHRRPAPARPISPIRTTPTATSPSASIPPGRPPSATTSSTG